MGAFLFSQIAPENQVGGNQNDSTAYAKQITRNLYPLPNRIARSEIVVSLRKPYLNGGIEQPTRLFALPMHHAIKPFVFELLNPQPLPVFNPTTRSPPASGSASLS